VAQTQTFAAAPVVQKEAPKEIAAISQSFSLFAVDQSEDSMAALNAVMAMDGASGGDYNMFPLFEQIRGNNGGMVAPDQGVEKDIARLLPVGYGPFNLNYITHRFHLACWSQKLGDGKSDTEAGATAKAKPVWDAIIGPADAAMVTLMSEAAAKYGKTKGVDRGKFDGFGHMTPSVEVLFFVPGVGLSVFRGVGHYKSTARTVQALFAASLEFRKANNLGSGSLIPFPGVFTPKSTEEQGFKPWKCHSLDAAFVFTPDTKKVWDEYRAFAAQVNEDAEAMRALNDWRTTACSTTAKAGMERMLAT
jgi:hypothetical protein